MKVKWLGVSGTNKHLGAVKNGEILEMNEDMVNYFLTFGLVEKITTPKKSKNKTVDAE